MEILKVSLQAVATAWCLWASLANGEELANKRHQVAEMFPSSVVAYAEASNVAEAIELIRNHPIKDRILALPAYNAVLQSGGLNQLQLGIAGFEATMQQPWPEAIATLSDGGIGVGLDKSGAVAIVMKSSDAKATERFHNLLLAFLPKNEGARIAKQHDYRGITAYELKGMMLTHMDGYLLVTNKPEMGKAIVDQLIDRTNESLASLPRFQEAQQELAVSGDDNDARVVAAYLDLDAVRQAGMAKNVLTERIDNIAGEVVLGGVLANVRHAPFITAAIDLNEAGIELQFRSPHDRGWEPPREYYFGEEAIAVAPRLIEINNRLFAVSTHRDFSQMWLRSGDLLSDRAVDGLAKADAQLSIFFSGRDFGEDILGSFDSGVQIVGRVPTGDDKRPQPAIKLPEFALLFRMKNSEKTQPEFRRVFQSFIGFLNVTGAMNGNPQLDLDMETVQTDRGEVQLVTSKFVPNQDQRESTSAPIQFNFSPTLAFAGERIIFSSSTSLAKDLARTGSNGNAVASSSNTTVTLDGESLKDILQVNREQLVAGNMLSKGQTKEEAEGEIGLLLELVGFLKDLNVDLDFNDDQMTFSAKVQVQ